MGDEIQPFQIQIPDAVLDDLRERLARTRFPDEVNDDDWSYGTSLAYLRQLCDYWERKFDWREQEGALNRFDQFTTEIDGLRIHFIHQRSKQPNALPICITHGWPGSIVEFTKIIGPLTDPIAHGGRAEDAFHVVCPSMPGYGFSQAASEPGMDVKRVAEIESKLMARLGYDRYGTQGGDWGAIVSALMGLVDPQHCAGIHMNMVVAGPPEGADNPAEGLSPKELEALVDMGKFQEQETGYQRIQGTKPQTLGYGLNDSPAGMAAWIVEKFRTWSDCDGDVESRFSKDELLTNITLYWATQTIGSSVRLYCETMRAGRFGPTSERIEVPTGAAIFPKEIYRPPRKWAEARYNLQHWTEMPSGGHFAALEEPAALVEDVRAFFRKVR
jgi:microsomal epoxide hydrolase